MIKPLPKKNHLVAQLHSFITLCKSTLLIDNTILFDSSDPFSSVFCEVGENGNRPELMSNLEVQEIYNSICSYAKKRSCLCV